MISLQKEKEKDEKQLEEVSWHRLVVLVVNSLFLQKN